MPESKGMSPVRSILLGMQQIALFPSSAAAPCRPADAPARRAGPSGESVRRTHSEQVRRVHGPARGLPATEVPAGGVVTVARRLSREEIDDLALAASAAPLLVRVRIATPDRRLASVLEPGIAPPHVRMATLRALRRAGLDAGLLVDPLMPGVTAQERDLEELLSQAHCAGASFAEARHRLAGPRRRGDLARRLREGYPRVAARLLVWERTACRSPEDERSRSEALFHAVRTRVGLPSARRGREDERAEPGGAGQRQFAFAGLDTQARGGTLKGKVRLGLGGLSPW